MKIHSCDQGSELWLHLHLGKATAGQFDNLISPKEFKVKRGDAHRSYVAKKLAEWFTGKPRDFGMTKWMENGLIREPNAIGAFELETGMEVKRVGFIETDNGAYGCSPDGVIGDCAGVEIKAPLPETHVKYLLAGGIPPEYAPQVWGSLFVTGFSQWWFMSYAVGFPSLIVKVEPDEQKEAAIKEALELFTMDFEAGKRYLCELNGGPPKRKEQKLSGQRPLHSWEQSPNFDIVTP